MQNNSLNKQTILALAVATASTFASLPASAADYSAGLGLGSYGIGVNITKRSSLSLREGDQIQWRTTLGGSQINDVDDMEISSTDYEGDFDVANLMAGLNWYPASEGFAKNIFVSGGLGYFDLGIEATSEEDQAFTIGDTSIAAADNVSLAIDVDRSSVAPYLSLGWGNRLTENAGFSFTAEVGVAAALSDADVSLAITDPDGLVSQDDLDLEQRQIEDDFDGLAGFAAISVGYRF